MLYCTSPFKDCIIKYFKGTGCPDSVSEPATKKETHTSLFTHISNGVWSHTAYGMNSL